MATKIILCGGATQTKVQAKFLILTLKPRKHTQSFGFTFSHASEYLGYAGRTRKLMCAWTDTSWEGSNVLTGRGGHKVRFYHR